MNDQRSRYIVIGAIAFLFAALCAAGILSATVSDTAYAGTTVSSASGSSSSSAQTTAATASGSSITVTPGDTADGPSENAKVVAISATYTGDTILVGERFKRKDVTVFVHYDDFYSEETTDFTVTDTLVTSSGANRFTVMAYGCTDTFYVYGKSVSEINVSNSRYSFSVGNAPDERDINVTVRYSDNSYETVTSGYTIEPEVFTEKGTQTVTVKYRNKTGTFRVFVEESKPVQSLSVYNSGAEFYTNSVIDRSKLTVTAVYSDNTTERITTYTVDPEKFSIPGDFKLKVSYGGKTAETNVKVKELEILSIRAEYTGDDVFIGTVYDKRFFHVYVTYNSGQELETEDYRAYNTRIRYIGNNTVRVYVGKLSTFVTITGREVGEPDFNYVSKTELTSNGYSIRISTAIPKLLDTDATFAESISKVKLKHLYRILKSDCKTYLGFKFGFVDDNNDKYLPMTVRLTLPEEFEPEYTELYYSPNNRTILACMNKISVDKKTLQIIIFKTGTYMLVYDPDKYKDEEET